MASVTITGLQKTINEIGEQVKKTRIAVDRGVVVTASNINRNAILAINKQSKGEVRPGKPKHIISKPGDAPNTDLGGLVGSLRVSHIKGSQEATVFSGLDYAAYLESPSLLNRPFLKPAADEEAPNLDNNINEQLRRLR